MRRALLPLLAPLALRAPLLAPACDGSRAGPPAHLLGDPDRGRALLRAYGCHTCHEIPGVAEARATVGPPLGRFGLRTFAGGRLNTPGHLIEFLIDPRGVDPRTPMPSVGLREDDARDVAAYLYTLR